MLACKWMPPLGSRSLCMACEGPWEMFSMIFQGWWYAEVFVNGWRWGFVHKSNSEPFALHHCKWCTEVSISFHYINRVCLTCLYDVTGNLRFRSPSQPLYLAFVLLAPSCRPACACRPLNVRDTSRVLASWRTTLKAEQEGLGWQEQRMYLTYLFLFTVHSLHENSCPTGTVPTAYLCVTVHSENGTPNYIILHCEASKKGPMPLTDVNNGHSITVVWTRILMCRKIYTLMKEIAQHKWFVLLTSFHFLFTGLTAVGRKSCE